MDFGKMKDQLSGEAGDKVKEELLKKVEEVKADVKGRFGQIPSGANLAPDASLATEQRNTAPSPANEDAVAAADKQTTEDDETKDDAAAVAKAPEADESESDDSAEEVA